MARLPESVPRVVGSRAGHPGLSRPRLGRRKSEAIAGYLFLLPDVIGLTLFVALPIAAAGYLSLHDWNGLSDPVFVGFANFQELLADAAFMDALRITVTYVVLFVPSVMILSLALAMLVNQKLRFTWFFRSAYFVPAMFSLVVASVVWTQMYQQRSGLLNSVLGAVGIAPQPWLGAPSQALLAVVIVALWQGVGYSMIIFLAGLQDIPAEYYEAAAIDGAGGWQRFWWITLPLLRRTTLFVAITSLIAAFQVFDPIYVLTSGGPANSTTTSVYYVYENAFFFLRFGYASAMSVVLFLIILAFTGVQLKLFSTSAD
jgi:multiple sugar transport system permease protein